MKYVWNLGGGLLGAFVGIIGSAVFVLGDNRLLIYQGETDKEIGTSIGVLLIMFVCTGGGIWIASRNRPRDWN